MESFVPASLERLAETMSTHARRFYEHGWMLGTSGNVSTRPKADRGMLISASGYHKGGLDPDQFVRCDRDGHPLEPHAESPSRDAVVHGRLYEHLDGVRAIYHVHHLEATLCSERDLERGHARFQRLAILEALGVDPRSERGLVVPVVEDAHDRERLAASILEGLEAAPPGDAPPKAANVHEHGLYVWGDAPEAAARHVEALAYLFDHRWERMRPQGLEADAQD